jgi:hypothetical protein
MLWIPRSICCTTIVRIIAGLLLIAFGSRLPAQAVSTAVSLTAQVDQVISLGSRRELLLDSYLVESLSNAHLKLHVPEARDVALVCDSPWEGNTSAYFIFFEDEGIFRCYYRGSHVLDGTQTATHPEFTCYAESTDGITFTKPDLGLFEYDGSKHNNIILTGTHATHNFAPFRDSNPAATPNSRYKALASSVVKVNGKNKSVLQAWQSPDAIHWSLMQDEPVISNGAFDSQNLAFFDPQIGVYRAYWRYFSDGDRVRAIRTATSKDFLNWENEHDLAYEDSPSEHLYTNAIQPLPGAAHLMIGFPTRFQPKTEQVEPVFMSSRDGVTFRRWPQALIPITAPKDRDGNRSNYMAAGMLTLPSEPGLVSVYAKEAYYKGPGSRIRRFVFRQDGFVSVHTEQSGSLITKPITFTGDHLHLNIRSQGISRAELQDAKGTAIPGFTLNDCQPIEGDAVDHTVRWSGGSLKPLNGQPARLRVELDRADLFALQFRDK